MPKPVRCVNLDWMEVHAREPLTSVRDASFFRANGWVVHEREYGTRVYREMFTLEASDGHDILEVRRNPASQGLMGIHDSNECHLRLVNRACYFDNAASWLAQFLNAYGYTDVRISRVDVCLDFVTFDKGDNPQDFVRRYFRGHYAKINQGNIASHGTERWDGREWNSISWGRPSSPISTKFYNKTLELYDPKTDTYRKPYIRQAWLIAGLIDDWQRCTKDGQKVNVWRVEFSIRSAVRNWVAIELNGKTKNFQSIRNDLSCYDTRAKILMIFASLSQHYFHFKKFIQGKRKDLCPDKILFDFEECESFYKVGRDNYAAGLGNKEWLMYGRLIAKLQEYQRTHFSKEIHDACSLLIDSMNQEDFAHELSAPWSKEETEMMRQLIQSNVTKQDLTAEEAMTFVKDLLHITDRTIQLKKAVQ